MAQSKALLLESIHPDAGRVLAQAGFSVAAVPGAEPPGRLARRLAGAALLGVRSRTPVTRELLRGAPGLLAVGCFCVGTDNVDLEACTDLGVAVFNAPYSNTRSVAELAIGERSEE
ncbi:MAG: phosphoglycerate dehydrogenase, partial [Elusimicrobia bacterium]|nr:phosphoglycerate dehydrogenase [Elusimicrobiota bacterium]